MGRKPLIDTKKALKSKLAGQSYSEIARAQGVSYQAVQQAVSPLLKQLPSAEEMAEIKRTTADHFALNAYRALKEMTDEKLQAASAKDLAVVAGVMTDKNRLLTGNSTSNVHILLDALASTEDPD